MEARSGMHKTKSVTASTTTCLNETDLKNFLALMVLLREACVWAGWKMMGCAGKAELASKHTGGQCGTFPAVGRIQGQNKKVKRQVKKAHSFFEG